MILATMALAASGTTQDERAARAQSAHPARLGALVLDLAIFGVVSLVVNSVYGVTQIATGSIPVAGTGVFEYQTVTAVAWPWLALLALAYYAVPEALFGSTPGKALVGVCVVRLDGAPLSVRDVIVRNLVRAVDWLPFLYLLGGLLVLFGSHGQRLGDMAAGTTVVRRTEAGEPGSTRTSGRGVRRVAAIGLTFLVLFTLVFDYFGRPDLIVEGMYNTHSLFAGPAGGYSVGPPQWGFGRVTYPVTVRTGGTTFNECRGSVTLEWSWLGWQQAGSSISCAG